MLKGIPAALSPALLKILCEMGHGDCIVLGDANFPSESIGSGKPVLRYDAVPATELLDAILQVFPLDTYVPTPVLLMEKVPGDTTETPIWEDYHRIVSVYDERGKEAIASLERNAYYEQAKRAYAVIATGETALYANLILKKGVVLPS